MDHYVKAEGFRIDSINRVRKTAVYPGGQGVNISLMLSMMGVDVFATGFVGGSEGRFIVENLQKSRVTTGFVHINNVTRNNYFVLDETDSSQTLIDEEGPHIKPYELDYFIKVYNRVLGKSQFVILAGSLPPGVPSSIYEELLDIAHQRGVKTVLTTVEKNIPANIEPYILKPDLRARAELKGILLENNIIRKNVACSLRQTGTGIVIITFDYINFIVSTPDECFEVIAPPLKTLSKLRTGDAFIAGMVLALYQEKTVKEAVVMGSAFSSASSTHIWGLIETKDDINQYIDRIAVNSI